MHTAPATAGYSWRFFFYGWHSIMMVYRIKDWDKHFENNRTRDIQKLTSVLVPNKLDGDGYTELISGHADGHVHYAAWIAIILIASKCKTRGTLLRATAVGHDTASLARLSRMPESVFTDAIPRLISVGWLESVDVDVEQVTSIPQEPAVETPQPAVETPSSAAPSRAGAQARANRTEPKPTELKPAGGVGGGEIELKCLEGLDLALLKDDLRLANLTRDLIAERPDIFEDSKEMFTLIVATAERSNRETETPVKLFRWTIRARAWDRVEEYMPRAKSRVAEYYSRKVASNGGCS